MKRKKLLIVLGSICLVLILAVLPFVAACAGPGPPAKESIKVGFGVSMTGYLSVGAVPSALNVNILWAEQVNERGGMYVEEYGKRLPVELIYYDDKGSPEESIKIYERLITADKVDLLLPPYATHIAWPLLPLVDKYRIPLLGATTGDEQFIGMDIEFFWMMPGGGLGHKNVPTLLSLLDAYDLKRVAVLYVHWPIALEQVPYLTSGLDEGGFETLVFKDYPLGITDMSEVLLDIKRKNPDAVIALSSPGDMILMLQQSIEIGLDPKFYYFQLSPTIGAFPNIFGPAADGISGMGSWYGDGPGPGSKEFYDSYVARWGEPPDMEDAALHWAAAEILEQAVEKAGTLDWEKLNEVIATERFTTIRGPVKYDLDHINYEGIDEAGGVIQWQKGEVEMIWPPGEFQTAQPLIPKPPWPK